VKQAKSGDAIFCHYSGEYSTESIVRLAHNVVNPSRVSPRETGHGGKLRDDDGDEKDGYDETMVPLDYESAGQIRDDDLFNTLVGPMPKGVTMTVVMDCCHSGTVLDLVSRFNCFRLKYCYFLYSHPSFSRSFSRPATRKCTRNLISISVLCCSWLPPSSLVSKEATLWQWQWLFVSNATSCRPSAKLNDPMAMVNL
jgi:hypothetical protein